MSSNLKSCSFSKVRANPLARHFFRHRICSLKPLAPAHTSAEYSSPFSLKPFGLVNIKLHALSVFAILTVARF